MPSLKKKLGLKIKELRKKLGYSQEKLAEIIDMDIPNLSNIECGKRFMTAETLEKIAKALKCSERELFDFSAVEPQRYLREDIDKILNSAKDCDLQFFLDIMKSYKKIGKK